jgi:hypothetical protein
LKNREKSSQARRLNAIALDGPPRRRTKATASAETAMPNETAFSQY